jgi:hypothetical protein
MDHQNATSVTTINESKVQHTNKIVSYMYQECGNRNSVYAAPFRVPVPMTPIAESYLVKVVFHPQRFKIGGCNVIGEDSRAVSFDAA